ncbi:MAG: FKBP-type peptidyl-prolyl cis-trans isomerase [Ignavibacteria bacterium]|jgi:FKBP-type peptidyl-prolyl cis-trans isomerase FklB
MNKLILLIAGLALSTSLVTAQKGAGSAASATTMTKQDSNMYALGMQIARSLQSQGLDLNIDMLAEGMRGFLSGTPKLSEQQFQSCMENLQKDAMSKMQAEQSAKGSANKERGEKFLAENKTKEGVKTTASGLQYKVVKEGTGKKPSKENTVKVHYTGTTIDGKVFDSSVERGEPIEFPLSGVIAGWTEGVALMPVGSKYTLYIPSNLAYGEQGAGQSIGPNEALIFEVELLDITK